LFHRWNVEGIDAKGKAAKGSAAKKSDNVESYVYRNDDNLICLPGEYVRQSMIHAAKYRQDPRSPRKSAMDLYKAGIVSLTMLAPVLTSKGIATSAEDEPSWDYEHRGRVVVQRAGITRTRPAFKLGWKTTMTFLVNLPEYIPLRDFQDVLVNAGRLVGVGDFRPSYGRFSVSSIALQQQEG